jgi:hypothetical protein
MGRERIQLPVTTDSPSKKLSSNRVDFYSEEQRTRERLSLSEVYNRQRLDVAQVA